MRLPAPALAHNLLPLFEFLLPGFVVVFIRSSCRDREGGINQFDADLLQILAILCSYILASGAISANQAVVPGDSIKQICAQNLLLVEVQDSLFKCRVCIS